MDFRQICKVVHGQTREQKWNRHGVDCRRRWINIRASITFLSILFQVLFNAQLDYNQSRDRYYCVSVCGRRGIYGESKMTNRIPVGRDCDAANIPGQRRVPQSKTLQSFLFVNVFSTTDMSQHHRYRRLLSSDVSESGFGDARSK
jgi:hypothetical protein